MASTLDGNSNALPPIEQCVSTPFQCIPARVGLAATAWAIFALEDVNPFLLSMPDSDGDGVPDPFDSDDDNDGMPDVFETANPTLAGIH